MITAKNLIKHELIGLDANVFDSSNKSLVNMKGKVLDETRSVLLFKTNKGMKKVQKKKSVFIFKIPNGQMVKVNGERIAYRPEDRIKLRVTKW